MARCRSGVRRATARKVLHSLIALSLFSLHVQQSLAIEANGQVFIQTDNELKFMIDGIPLPVSPTDGLYRNIKLPSTRDKLFTDGGGIHFFPAQLDFSRQSVGMPKMEQVTVVNSDPVNSLHLLSISGSTVHFHCSFFQDKMVPPGGNTSFDVVFLARQIGKVENTLYIHTSQGTFKYQVFGVGTANPYRLKPLIGARVPVNSSFAPVIHMHNPHSTPLQVVEMFTSGGDLHLELPVNGPSLSFGGPVTNHINASFWELKPYETRPLMRASFVGRVESNHTAYIRIRTSRESATSELLVLPLEVEVTSDPGLYSPYHTIDFGLMRAKDVPQQQKLLVLSSLPKALKIASITVVPQNDAVTVTLEEPMRVLAGVRRPTSIATVTFDPSRVTKPRQLSGKLVVKTKTGGHSLIVPYCAEVVHGDVAYSEANVQFYIGDVAGDGGSLIRNLAVSNTFDNTVAITHVALRLPSPDYESVLQVSHPPLPLLLSALQTADAIAVTYSRPRKSSPLSDGGKLTVPLVLYTNVSTFTIPLCVYDGKLKVTFQHSEKELDFGTLGFGESRILYFTLTNENPVSVVIQELFATAGLTIIELYAVDKANTTSRRVVQQSKEGGKNSQAPDVRRLPADADSLAKSALVTNAVGGDGKEWLVLSPYDSAIYRVNLTAPSEEAIYSVDARVTTNYETFYVPIRFQATEGSVRSVPERIVFEKAFPGKVLFKVLKIRSSFAQHTQVSKISFVPNDPRFYYKPSLSTPAILEPYEDTAIGLLYFDASRTCGDDCYVGGLGAGVDASSSRQQQWLQGLRLDYGVVDIDQYLYARRRMKWEELVYYGRHVINVTVQIDTDPVRGFLFPVQAKLQWPTIIKERKISFPVTQIGNLSVESVAVENPLDVPLLIQILPVSLYPNPTLVLDLIESSLMEELDSYIEIEDTDVFTLQNLEVYNRAPNNPVTKYRRHIESTTGVEPHEQSIATVLSPGVRVNVLLGFEPRDAIPRSSVILVRNNLTIIDALIVQGKGAYSEVVVSEKPVTTPAYSRPYDSSLPNLVFNLNEKVMQSCDVDLDTHLVFSGKVMKVYRSSLGFYMVKKTFIVQNLGELPVFVQDIRINAEPCRDAGFEVLTCEGFELPVNGSRKIDVSYVPDFSQPITTASLNLETSAGDVVNSTLRAVTPARLLGRCAAALQRPFWEGFVLRCCVFVSALTFVFVFAIAYVDMRRLFEASAEERARLASRCTVFSLAPVTSASSRTGQASQAALTSAPHAAAGATAVTAAARRTAVESHHHGRGKKRQSLNEVPSGGSAVGSAVPIASVKPALHRTDSRSEAAVAPAARRLSGGSSSSSGVAGTGGSSVIVAVDLHRNSTDESVTGVGGGSDNGSDGILTALAGKGSEKTGKRAKRRAAAAAAAAAAASAPLSSAAGSEGGSGAPDAFPWLNAIPSASASAGVGVISNSGSRDVAATAAAIVAPTRRVNARATAKDGKKADVPVPGSLEACKAATAAAAPALSHGQAIVSTSRDQDGGTSSSGGEELLTVGKAGSAETEVSWPQKLTTMKLSLGQNGTSVRPSLRLPLPLTLRTAASPDSLSSSSPDSCADDSLCPATASQEPSFSQQRPVPVARCPANARMDTTTRSTVSAAATSAGAVSGDETSSVAASKKLEATAWCTRPAQSPPYQDVIVDHVSSSTYHQQPQAGAAAGRPQRLHLPENRASYDQRQPSSVGKLSGYAKEVTIFPGECDADDISLESPSSPIWDMPRLGYGSAMAEDFADISNQTAAFAASELKAAHLQPAASTATAAVIPIRRHSSLGLVTDASHKGLSPSWLPASPLQQPAMQPSWPSQDSSDSFFHKPAPIGSRPAPRRDQLTMNTFNALGQAPALNRASSLVPGIGPYGNTAMNSGISGSSRTDQPKQRAGSMQRLRSPLLDYDGQHMEADFSPLPSPSPLSESWMRPGQHSGLDGNMSWQADIGDAYSAPLPDIFSPSSVGCQDLLGPSSGSSSSPWGDTNWSIWSSPQTQAAWAGGSSSEQETTSNYGLLGGYDGGIWRPRPMEQPSNRTTGDVVGSDYQWMQQTTINIRPGSTNTEK